MADPVKERILAAIETALKTITGVTGFTAASVERDRADDQPVTDEEMPRVLIYDGGARQDPVWTGQDDYTVRVEIHGAALGDDMAAARALGALLAAKVQAKLFADVTLGGLCSDIRLADEAPPPRLALPVAARGYGFDLAFDVDFATKEGDPENLP